jgi:mercuric ion transport protein
MTDPTQPGMSPRRGALKAPLLLADGGAAAGFCAASCCGLPVLLWSAGLGSGWLATLAWFAAPYRIVLLIAALLVGGALVVLGYLCPPVQAGQIPTCRPGS